MPGQTLVKQSAVIIETSYLACGCHLVQAKLSPHQSRQIAFDHVSCERLDVHRVFSTHHLTGANGSQNRQFILGELLEIFLGLHIGISLDALKLVQDLLSLLRGNFHEGVKAEIDRLVDKVLCQLTTDISIGVSLNN